MNPQDVTNEVLDRVLALTGKPVIVTADPSLKLLATSKAATATSPAHVLRYSPAAAANADYVICFQCGFILRQQVAGPTGHRDVGPTWHGRKEVERLLREHARLPGSVPVAKELRDGLRDQMYDGLIRQLRSVPVGLRIDDWLRTEFPTLIPQQDALIDNQLRECLAALGPQIRRLAPARLFEANASMNAAFAAFWSDRRGDTLLSMPYRAAGLSERGEALLAVWRDVPADAAHDTDLIGRWGEALGIQGWYEFVAAAT